MKQSVKLMALFLLLLVNIENVLKKDFRVMRWEEVKTMKRPFDRLVRRAEDMGYRQIMDLGALCGLNRTTISSRVNGKTEWRRHDIEVLCQVLEIPQEEIGLYFYPQIGSLKK